MNDLVNAGGHKPPTVWKPVRLSHFIEFAADLDLLVEFYESLRDVIRSIRSDEVPEIDDLTIDYDETYQPIIADCRESMRRYDRDGDDDPRYDEDGDLTFEHTAAPWAGCCSAGGQTTARNLQR
jgi:hypothetical protein